MIGETLDIIDSTIHALQRVVRGWDDTVVWSVDYWLDDIMPDILLRLMKDKHGTPVKFFECFGDDKWDYSDAETEVAGMLWEAELWKMIAGFLASKEIEDFDYEGSEDYKIKYERLDTIRKIGMSSFVEHYKSLWD